MKRGKSSDVLVNSITKKGGKLGGEGKGNGRDKWKEKEQRGRGKNERI